jgi:polyisoprenoid-binding protein YceI
MTRNRLRSIISFLVVTLLLFGGAAHAQRSTDTALEVYQIDAARSDIHLLVYRAGLISQLGHNHVVSVGDLKGTISLSPGLDRSKVELEVPVDRLIVDDPALRRREGEAFSTQPSKDDIDGTRGNMLGPRLLNAKQYPVIKVTGTSGRVSDKQTAMVDVSVELLGRTVKLAVPATLRQTGDELEVSGALKVSHAQLGLTPFSALMGALQVADEMDLKYRIRARRAAK